MGNAVPNNTLKKIFYFEVYDNESGNLASIVESTDLVAIQTEYAKSREAGDDVSLIQYKEANTRLTI